MHAYGRIERQLGGAGHYASIRDVAAKAAEHIARLAALLHVLSHGLAGEIDERGRARVEQEGRHRFVVVNPALLAGLPAGA